jgi:hypothetical protein
MDIISQELGEIEDEHYEINRFLSNLFTFSFDVTTLKDILGDMIYESCKDTLSRFRNRFEKRWTDDAKTTLAAFITENESTKKKLKERLMINLITLDANKPK